MVCCPRMSVACTAMSIRIAARAISTMLCPPTPASTNASAATTNAAPVMGRVSPRSAQCPANGATAAPAAPTSAKMPTPIGE